MPNTTSSLDCDKNETTSTWPRAAARCSGVSPSVVWQANDPLARTSCWAMSKCPCCAAMCNGVDPPSVRAAGSARASRSCATHPACPAAEERCKAVRPCNERALTRQTLPSVTLSPHSRAAPSAAQLRSVSSSDMVDSERSDDNSSMLPERAANHRRSSILRCSCHHDPQGGRGVICNLFGSDQAPKKLSSGSASKFRTSPVSKFRIPNISGGGAKLPCDPDFTGAGAVEEPHDSAEEADCTASPAVDDVHEAGEGRVHARAPAASSALHALTQLDVPTAESK
mmetsp:Transcript_95430/g.274877  ORF Transcript_95430/g.274877 Transcript_95430/m.274877 type:complete len:283 (-) Transcript_95430:182-1030(-)